MGIFTMVYLIIAGFAESLIGFRKPFIQALLKKGLLVHVVAPELLANEKAVEELSSLGVICHDISMQRTGMNPFSDLKSLISIWLLIRKVSPDFVMGYTIKPVIYGTLAASLARVPNRFALITGLGFAFIDEDGGRSKVRNLVQKLYRFSLKRCNVVFFQNPDDERLFRELRILRTSTTSFVVNGSGIDISQFLKETLPINGPLRFLLIGRLIGDKGVREYALAASKVKTLYPDVQFDLAGWIDENPNSITQPELNKWIEEGTINYLGRLSNVKPAIKNCSVYVLPSYREGTPRTVLEAMAIGRAIITTDAPGCRETVIDGENGLLIPIKNVQALASAMIKLIEEPELLKKMGHRSRIIAVDKYDVNKVNSQMLKGMKL